MNSRLPLTLKQLLILIAVVAFLTAIITLGIFTLGQIYGLNQSRGFSLFGPTATATMPPLPKAMTATPRPKTAQVYIMSEQEINRVVASQAGVGAPIVVDWVDIRADQMLASGTIAYSGYEGRIELAGSPYVENKKLRFQLTSLTLDGQILPSVLYPTVEEQINLLFDQLLTGYDIESVELAEDQMGLNVIPW